MLYPGNPAVPKSQLLNVAGRVQPCAIKRHNALVGRLLHSWAVLVRFTIGRDQEERALGACRVLNCLCHSLLDKAREQLARRRGAKLQLIALNIVDCLSGIGHVKQALNFRVSDLFECRRRKDGPDVDSSFVVRSSLRNYSLDEL